MAQAIGPTSWKNASAKCCARRANRPAGSMRWDRRWPAPGRDGPVPSTSGWFGDPSVGQSMEATTRNTMDSLRVLHERLGIIDNAHKNLTDLTSQVTTLRDVLANKQSRGAFGQARMEAIVQDGMPKAAYEFQYTLSSASGRIAWCSCRTSARSASTRNFRWKR